MPFTWPWPGMPFCIMLTCAIFESVRRRAHALLTGSVVLLWFNGKSRWLSACDYAVVTHASVGSNCGSAGLVLGSRDVDGGV
jgi:hypothetical protein